MTAIAPPADEGALEGLSVLVVDDDAVTRIAHEAILRKAGLDVSSVANGPDALAAVDAGGVDLVLLDSRMPGMSGLDVLTTLRAEGHRLPVMLVTGATDLADRVQGLEQGADDYVTKPVDATEIVARIRAVLRNRRAALAEEAEGRRDGDRAARERIVEVIEGRRFHPVFQPIVRLADGALVAYEALTRFDDGTRPDLFFAEADRLGLTGLAQVATLRAAVESSSLLEEHVSVHLNVSPVLLEDPVLREVLASAPRPVVVEITEHDPIDDYARVSELLGALGDAVHLAVDDAGAGYASLTHILALDPDEVKLDVEWVRGVDTDIARRALVAGLVTFAGATGTTLVAEGIETESELEALRELGVDLGQGYHLGRPRRVDED